jgi:uncharacterized membrane protein YciS (DUF1049 family)
LADEGFVLGDEFQIHWDVHDHPHDGSGINHRLMHNLAVVFWITANCTWMIGEFFGIDEGSYGLRTMAIIPFSIGLAILAYFYIRFYTQKNIRKKVMEQTYETIEKELTK